MALTSILFTARDALAAQSYGVSVTSQNITNANTEGYVRREAVLQTRIHGSATYGSVEIEGLRRASDAFLEGQHFSSLGKSEASAERDAQLSVLEAVFNDLAGAGIGSALDSINRSFQQLSVDPSDTIAREDVLASLGEFVSRVHETGETLASQRTEIFNHMQNLVSEMNEYADEIASLNKQIQIAEAQGETAADLRDRRGLVLLQLAPIVNINVVEHDNGSILVQASGATLVDGAEARQFDLDIASSGDARLLARRTDGSFSDVTRGLTGGALEGLKVVRDDDITQIQNQLDEYVYDFATALNTQHATGFGLDASTGSDLFDLNLAGLPPSGAAQTITISADVFGQPEKIAAADSLATTPGSGENAKALTQIFDQAVTFSSSRTPSEGYSDLVGNLGLRRANAKRENEVHEAMAAQFQQLNESVSGVSLDEEMVALTRYQRAYQAASRVLTTADELLQELLGAVR